MHAVQGTETHTHAGTHASSTSPPPDKHTRRHVLTCQYKDWSFIIGLDAAKKHALLGCILAGLIRWRWTLLTHTYTLTKSSMCKMTPSARFLTEPVRIVRLNVNSCAWTPPSGYLRATKCGTICVCVCVCVCLLTQSSRSSSVLTGRSSQ